MCTTRPSDNDIWPLLLG